MVALSLVACSSSPSDAACDATPSGAHSSTIKVSGDFSKEPTVTMPPAFDAKDTERSVLISGKGTPAVEGDVVTAKYAAYNASNGKSLELEKGVKWSEQSFLLNKTKSFPGIYKALLCAHVGDRIVSAIPSSDLFGGMKVDMSAAGISPKDTLVFVFDVSKVAPAPKESASPTPGASVPPKSLPAPTPWADNVPTVDLNQKAPVVTLPKTDPPAALELKVITEGTGAVVAADSTVSVDYQGTSWNSGKIFDQSYTRGTPSSFPVSGVIDGFAAAMVGQKVGATVIVTIPPKFAYGEGAINDQNLAGQTLVFLIQIRDAK